MKGTTYIHMGFEIDYLLKKALDGEEKVLENKNGKTLSNEETIVSLCKYRAKGMKIIPMGFCDNMDKTGRCLGHKTKKERKK